MAVVGRDAPSPVAFWLRFAALLPVTGAQGAWLRRTAPRLPPTLDNGAGGRAGTGDTVLTLLVAGESPAVGVGCAHSDETVTVRLAEQLAEGVGGAVDWSVIGANGARAADIARLLHTRRPRPVEPDRVALVMLGVNDVTGCRTLRHWHEQLVAIRTRLRQRGFGRIFLAPVPPVWLFTLLPRPLRGLLGDRARQLDAARRQFAGGYDDVTALTSAFPPRESLLAEDGFHPNAEACALWAEQLAAQMLADDQP